MPEQDRSPDQAVIKRREQTLKVAIYCRVSTKAQADDEIPIEGQIDECTKYAQERGWQIVRVYEDAGYSGGSDERPAFQEMYAAARDNKPAPFDIVLTWRLNRISRALEHRLAYSRLFRRYNVRIVSLHEPEFEGASGHFMEAVLAAADEMYRSQASEDTLRGLKLIARRGFSAGGRPPTGYLNVRVPTGRIRPGGDPEIRTSWEPDPVMAPRVNRAFEMCAEGKTSVEIVEATGVVSAKNGLSTLLRNRAYLGERVYNATRRASLSEKKTRRLRNAPEEVVRVPGCHPPIVSPELFARVQAILDAKRPKMGQQKRSPANYILSGLVWCKEHDVPYTGHTTATDYYYACALRKKLGKKRAPCPWLKKKPLEAFVLDALAKKIFNRDIVRQGLEWLQVENARRKQEDDSALQEVQAEIDKAHHDLALFQNAILGGVHPDAVAEPMNELDSKVKRAGRRLAEIQKDRERAMNIPPVTEAMVDAALSKIAYMLTNTNLGELKGTLAHFVERIEVEGEELTFFYSFAKPVASIMPTTGDPEGDRGSDFILLAKSSQLSLKNGSNSGWGFTATTLLS